MEIPGQVPNGEGKFKISISVVVIIVIAAIGGTWTIQQSIIADQKTQTRTIADFKADQSETIADLKANQGQALAQLRQGYRSHERRIESLERVVQDIPAQISGMSKDIRYLRNSVEDIMEDWWARTRSQRRSQRKEERVHD